MRKGLVYLFICISHLLNAQGVSKACVQKVREFSSRSDATLPGGQVIYVHYTQQIVMRDSINNPKVETEVRMWMNKDHLQYITPDIEVYQDKRDAFMIIHSKKKVIWGQSDMESAGMGRVEKIVSLQDTLFDLSVPLLCEIYSTKEGKEMIRLVLKTNNAGRELFNIDQIEYTYNNQTGNPERVITNFIPSYGIKRSVVTYKANDNNYKGLKLDKPVSHKIVSSNNSLLAKYKGYQLLDNR